MAQNTETAVVTPGAYTEEADYREAVASLKSAAMAYYDADLLEMDDATYDIMVRRVAATEAARPEWGSSGLTDTVAGGVSRGGDVAHSGAMLSLDNAMDQDELDAWYVRLQKTLGTSTDISLAVEPKLDGLAIAARYVDGKLDVVITRGDGTTGEDVTGQLRDVRGLPQQASSELAQASFEVRGEVFLRADDFDAANESRINAGKPAFVNPRNAAAGAVRNQKSTYKVPLSFAAYGFTGHAKADGTHTGAMAFLAGAGFDTAGTVALERAGKPVSGIAEAKTLVGEFEAGRATLGFDIDGAVIKADAADDRAHAGATGKAPRWAIAFKYPPDTRMTVLNDIIVDLGRTGACTPVAVLEPVFVGGTTIERATLHNSFEIARKDLRIGDTVWVRRAGEVIPEIVSVQLDKRPETAQPWVMPETCPRCGSTLGKTQQVWRCPNRSCGAAEQVEYFASRGCLDIENLGETLVKQLVKEGLVADVADLYNLTVAQLSRLDRMAETSATKVVTNIEASKTQPLSRVFAGLGVRLTGRRMSKRLANHFKTMANLRNASVEELAEVEGVGPIRAASIVAEVAELSGLIDRLEAAGLNMNEAVEEVAAGGPFDGKSVVVSGTVPGMSRDQAREAVERLGGKSSSSVTSKTDLLVAGPGAGSKLAKAEKLGVQVMDSTEFAELAGGQ